MGTRVIPPSNAAPVTNIDPGNQVGTDQVGLLVELRVLTLLINIAFDLDIDLDALRRSVLPFTS